MVESLIGETGRLLTATDDNPQDLVANHPKLYHYTDARGLTGILSSQSLRATHFKFLNDSTEVIYLRQKLQRKIAARFVEYLKGVRKQSFNERRRLAGMGGAVAVANQEAVNVVDIFFGLTFGTASKKGRPYAEPFITSFCSHQSASSYVHKNGLLSQWRAYGRDGGFAIVFDSKRLLALAREEARRFIYSAWVLGPVIYEGDEYAEAREFLPFVDSVVERHLEYIETGNMPGMDKAFYDLVKMAARYKHQAFREECEVRLIWCPMPDDLADASRHEDKEGKLTGMANKEIKYRSDGKIEIPYVEVFGLGKPLELPIERIIIGPHPDQGSLEQQAYAAIGRRRIKVVRSDTPFIGQR